MPEDPCERCLGNGSVLGYRRGMLNGVPCPDCRPDAFERDDGRVADDV